MPKAIVMFVATTAVGGGGTVVGILFAGGGGDPFGTCGGPFGTGGPAGTGKSTLAFVGGGLFGDCVLALFAEGGYSGLGTARFGIGVSGGDFVGVLGFGGVVGGLGFDGDGAATFDRKNSVVNPESTLASGLAFAGTGLAFAGTGASAAIGRAAFPPS